MKFVPASIALADVTRLAIAETYGPKSVGILIPRDTFRARETLAGARRATLLPAARNFSARPAKLLGRARNFWAARNFFDRRETVEYTVSIQLVSRKSLNKCIKYSIRAGCNRAVAGREGRTGSVHHRLVLECVAPLATTVYTYFSGISYLDLHNTAQ